MGIPKYLENKIKAIFHCCIAPIQALITPKSSTFILRRPNDENFVLSNDKATVGMANYADGTGAIVTGRQLGGVDVYEQRFNVNLTTTGGNTLLFTGAGKLIEADITFLDGTNDLQYILNGTINSLCDATIKLDINNLDTILTWSTPHTVDSLVIYVRYILP